MIHRIAPPAQQPSRAEMVDDPDQVTLAQVEDTGQLLLGAWTGIFERDRDGEVGGTQIMSGERRRERMASRGGRATACAGEEGSVRFYGPVRRNDAFLAAAGDRSGTEKAIWQRLIRP